MGSGLHRELFVPRRIRHQHTYVIARIAALYYRIDRCLCRGSRFEKACYESLGHPDSSRHIKILKNQTGECRSTLNANQLRGIEGLKVSCGSRR
jgi:hypothetical protein